MSHYQDAQRKYIEPSIISELGYYASHGTPQQQSLITELADITQNMPADMAPKAQQEYIYAELKKMTEGQHEHDPRHYATQHLVHQLMYHLDPNPVKSSQEKAIERDTSDIKSNRKTSWVTSGVLGSIALAAGMGMASFNRHAEEETKLLPPKEAAVAPLEPEAVEGMKFAARITGNTKSGHKGQRVQRTASDYVKSLEEMRNETTNDGQPILTEKGKEAVDKYITAIKEYSEAKKPLNAARSDIALSSSLANFLMTVSGLAAVAAVGAGYKGKREHDLVNKLEKPLDEIQQRRDKITATIIETMVKLAQPQQSVAI